ncbi:MAG TPA: Spo0B domain-containing protein [Syntrophomonadaceae bacterium]|nr:Spo0B domain-containing protein [Syntrophomonadaceae bacterium]
MEDAKVVSLIRRLRHDLGNHLQVISGFAELGRVQDLRDYIKDVSEEMAGERIVFEKQEPEPALYLFQVILFARDLGILLKYRDLELATYQPLIKGNEPFKSLAQVAEQLGELDEDPVVLLSIKDEEQGIRMIFECEQLTKGPIEVCLKE